MVGNVGTGFDEVVESFASSPDIASSSSLCSEKKIQNLNGKRKCSLTRFTSNQCAKERTQIITEEITFTFFKSIQSHLFADKVFFIFEIKIVLI